MMPRPLVGGQVCISPARLQPQHLPLMSVRLICCFYSHCCNCLSFFLLAGKCSRVKKKKKNVLAKCCFRWQTVQATCLPLSSPSGFANNFVDSTQPVNVKFVEAFKECLCAHRRITTHAPTATTGSFFRWKSPTLNWLVNVCPPTSNMTGREKFARWTQQTPNTFVGEVVNGRTGFDE